MERPYHDNTVSPDAVVSSVQRPSSLRKAQRSIQLEEQPFNKVVTEPWNAAVFGHTATASSPYNTDPNNRDLNINAPRIW